MEHSDESVFDRLEKAENEFQKILDEEISEGNIIKFGRYNGKALEWEVLRVWKREKKVLLHSMMAVCQKEYNADYISITWEECTLRKWLNTKFISELNLSNKEKSRILPVLNRNDNNPRDGIPGGNQTWDRMFLLSIKEAERYLKNTTDRVCRELDSREAVWWWLRSPGSVVDSATCVRSDGSISYRGLDVLDDFGYVRPAFYLNLES